MEILVAHSFGSDGTRVDPAGEPPLAALASTSIASSRELEVNGASAVISC